MKTFNKHITLLLIALSLTCSAEAQELHETIHVEGTYRPDIIKSDRFNVFPEQTPVTLPAKPLSFDTRGVTASFQPEARAIDILGWRTERGSSARGYLDLSLGSWLNSSLSAGYAAIDRRNTRLDISLQHNSTSLWKPFKDIASESFSRYRYDESLGARFCHRFPHAGLLEAQLQYRLSAFNYYFFDPYTLAPLSGTARPDGQPKAPSQTLNDVAFRIGFSSNKGGIGGWHASVNARYFGMNSLYLPSLSTLSAPESFKGVKETLIGAEGGYSLTWDNGSRIGIDGNLDDLLYNSLKAPFGLSNPDNYGLLTLRPYYSFTRDNLLVRVGVTTDLAFNAPGEDTDSHFSFFHIAPDIKADWQSGLLGVYLHLGGGTELETLANRFQEFYYTMPALDAAQPVHTPLDARLGIQIGPIKGFSAGIEAAFRTQSHLPYAGWYPAFLNYDERAYPGLTLPSGTYPLYSVSSMSRNLNGWRMQLNASYTGAIFSIEGRAAYMPQKENNGWCDGIDRYRWDISAKLKINPVKPLRLSVGYDYHGVRFLDLPRRIYDGSDFTVINGERTGSTPVRLPDLCMLSASASWDFSEKFSLGVAGNNLLNSKAEYLPLLPSQGIDVRGTLTVKF